MSFIRIENKIGRYVRQVRGFSPDLFDLYSVAILSELLGFIVSGGNFIIRYAKDIVLMADMKKIQDLLDRLVKRK